MRQIRANPMSSWDSGSSKGLEMLPIPVNVLSANEKRGGAAEAARPRLTRWKLMSVSQATSVAGGRPGCGDKRRLVKTKTPGVFKRVDGEGQVVGYVCRLPQSPAGSESATRAPMTRRGGSSARARLTATAASCRSARRSPSWPTLTSGSSATAARAGAASARTPATTTAARSRATPTPTSPAG